MLQTTPKDRRGIPGYTLKYDIQATCTAISGRRPDIIFEGNGARAMILSDEGKKKWQEFHRRPAATFLIQLPRISDAVLYEPQPARVMRGYGNHESAHCRYTDWAALEQGKRQARTKAPNAKATDSVVEIYSTVSNIIEDCYIEKSVTRDYPGSRYNLDATRAYVTERATENAARYAQSGNLLGAIYEALLQTCNIINGWTCQPISTSILDELAGFFPGAVNIASAYKSRIAELKTSRDSHELSFEVFEDVLHLLSQQPGSGESDNPGESSGERQGSPSDSGTSSDDSDQSDQDSKEDDPEHGQPSSSGQSSEDTPSESDDEQNGDDSQSDSGDGESDDADQGQKGASGDKDQQDPSANDPGTGDQDRQPGQTGQHDQSDQSDTDDRADSDSGNQNAADQSNGDCPANPSQSSNGKAGSGSQQSDQNSSQPDKTPEQDKSDQPQPGDDPAQALAKALDAADAFPQFNPMDLDDLFDEIDKITEEAVNALTNAHGILGAQREINGIVEHHHKPPLGTHSIRREAADPRTARAIRTLIRSHKRDRTTPRREDGDFDHANILSQAIGAPDIYKSTVRAIMPNTAMAILADQSISMRSLLDLVGTVLAALGEASLGVPKLKTALYGFTSDESSLDFHIIKDFNDSPLAARAALNQWRQAPGDLGGTPTSTAMLEAARRLDLCREQKKILLLITDGQPNDPAATAAAHDLLKRRGFITCLIELGSHPILRLPFDIARIANKIDDLPAIFLEIAREAVKPQYKKIA